MSVYNSHKALVSSETFSGEGLLRLVTEACKHQVGSAERQKSLTKIIRLATTKLWNENTPYYQDALQQTWLYFCQAICEGNIVTSYNLTSDNLIIWLNFQLKQRLLNLYVNKQKEEAATDSMPIEPLDSSGTKQTVELVENNPANSDVPQLIEEVRRWVETDPEGELRRIHITNHPEVTCQVLILRRLPPEVSWKTLAVEFNLPVATLSSFYYHKCLPSLRKFGEVQEHF